MNPANLTDTNTNNLVVRPLPPDQISPRAVILRIMLLKGVFQRNWKLILLITLTGGIIGFIVDRTKSRKPTYNAAILFNLGGGSGSNSFGDLGALAGAFGLGNSAPDASIFTGENFLIYAKSRPVLEKTLMKTVNIHNHDTLLVDYYINHSGIRDKEWEDNDTLRTVQFGRAKKPEEYNKNEINASAQIIARIATEMSVSLPERKSTFTQLKAAMEDEMLAKTFVETHLKTIEEDYRRKQTKKTSDMLAVLEYRADSLKGQLYGTESRLAQYRDQNQQVVVASGVISENRLTRNTAFLQTQYYQALQSVESMRLSLMREAPLFTIIEPVALPLYKDVASAVAMQIGLIVGLLLSLLTVFLRETYRTVMREG